MGLVIFQPTLVQYRIKFFSELFHKLNGALVVYAGGSVPGMSQNDLKNEFPWRKEVKNTWLFDNKLMIQSPFHKITLDDKIVVLNLNPRFIHNWVILVARAILRKRTLLWGHLHSRSGNLVWSNRLRELQIALSSGLLVYVGTEKKLLNESLINKRCIALGNSSVMAHDCQPAGTGFKNGNTSIIYVGRIDASKKVGLLAAAFSMIVDKYPWVNLKIIGDGEERARIERDHAELIASGRIILLKWVWDPEELRKHYGGALLAVSPGYSGLNLIQAFAHGVPVIVADKENHAPEVEACRAGFNSLWFRKDDSADLANQIEVILNAATEWSGKRQSISISMRGNYTIEGMVDRFMQMIDAIGPSTNPY